MLNYEELNLKELKKNYDYGDICMLEYLKKFIPDNPNDEINKLFIDVCNYNEIYANGWTINNLFEMGKDDKYWIDRANNFIKKYNISKAEYDEHSAFFDKYKDLLDTLLTNMGINTNILEMDIKKIPEKGFIDGETLTSTKELDEENSFTVARILNFCHCVELHYYKGEATIEYGTKINYDCWKNEIEDADWFDKKMSDEEVCNKLDELFKDYFGEEEFVIQGENNEVCNML